jgi:peptidyl-prolyl cis-trans isomerase B (cyclophilin B)
MIQGGDPEGSGMGGPDTASAAIHFQPLQQHPQARPRVLSMARTNRPNSAGSQFFIMHQKAPHLDGDYAAFGKVIEGLEVVDRIVSAPCDYSDKPKTPQIMKTVTADTFGVDYPEPEKV